MVSFVNEKYSANGASNTTIQTGIQWALDSNNIHSYYKVVTRTSSDGTAIVEKLELDANTYANVSQTISTYTLQNGSQITETTSKQVKTYFEYETEVNESKREINILKKEFVTAVEKEFKKIINT